MDFADRIRDLASRVPRQLDHVASEEATKNALVMPFLSALGYDVFDPSEVTPELHADVGTKKGERVDYAVLRDGEPILLVECKSCNQSLDGCHASQLYRYFSVTSARIGILTNGVVYRFFSDLDEPNRMDSKPFFEVDLLDLADAQVVELKKFSKSEFSLDQVLDSASDLKYKGEIKKILAQEIADPSEELVRFFTSRVYSGRLTKPVRAQFTDITRNAIQEFIRDRIRERLESALARETMPIPAATGDDAIGPAEESASQGDSDIVTTAEELEGFHIVRAILSELVDPGRVTLRDVKSYCGILLDDNNRKPICRLHFNSAQKYLGVFDAEKNEERHALERVRDLYRFARPLRDTVERYDPSLGSASLSTV